MENNMMGTSEAAEKWGVAQSTVQKWCRERGKREGFAEQDEPEHPWRIHTDTPNPFARRKENKFETKRRNSTAGKERKKASPR